MIIGNLINLLVSDGPSEIGRSSWRSLSRLVEKKRDSSRNSREQLSRSTSSHSAIPSFLTWFQIRIILANLDYISLTIWNFYSPLLRMTDYLNKYFSPSSFGFGNECVSDISSFDDSFFVFLCYFIEFNEIFATSTSQLPSSIDIN